MNDSTPNPARYREMCVPHDSQEAGNAALSAFYAEVEAARVRHRIADVEVLALIRYVSGKSEAEGMGRVHFGDELRSLPMLAEAYGRERRAHEELLARMLAKGGGR